MAKRNIKIQDFDVGGNLPGSLKTNCAQLGHKSFKVVVSGDDNKNVVLWKLSKSNPLIVFQGHSSDITTVAFSTTEEEVYSGSYGGTVIVWDLNSQRAVSSLKGHMAACTSIAPFPSSSHPYLATGSADHNVKVWDLRRKSCIQTFKGHSNTVTCVQFSPDNRWVASASDDGNIRIWDLNASRKLAEMSLGGSGVTCFRFNPQNLSMASGHQDRTVKYWDLESFVHIASTQTESTPIQAITFEPSQGRMLFSASHESLKLWEIEKGLLVDNIESSWRGVQDIGVSSRGDALIGVCINGSNFSAWTTDLSNIDFAAERTEEQKVPHGQPRRKNPQMSASFIPTDQTGPIDIDPLEFMPKQQAPFNKKLFDDIRQSHDSVMTLLKRKHDNLNLVLNWHSAGNVAAAINSLKMMNEISVTVDVLGNWIADGASETLNLDNCKQILPLTVLCVESKYENHIRVGAQTALTLIKQFSGVIASTLTAPASTGVDLSREDRIKKCEATLMSFVQLRESPALEKNSRRENKTGELIKELIRQLDVLIWSCSKR